MQITLHDVANFQRKQKVSSALVVRDSEPVKNLGTYAPINETALVIRAKGGRPKGSTVAKKRDFDTAMIAARNEIAAIYQKEKRQHGRAKKRMRKGRLDAIIECVKTRRNLPDSIVISPYHIHKRSDRKSILIMNKNGKGAVSPLLHYEDNL